MRNDPDTNADPYPLSTFFRTIIDMMREKMGPERFAALLSEWQEEVKNQNAK